MNATVSVHTLYFPQSDQRIVQSHRQVMKKLRVPVNYHEKVIDHGEWMNSVMQNSREEVVGFLDIDCVPLNEQAIPEIIRFVIKNSSLAGNAQVSNHIPPMSHIFIAPSCFFISRELFDLLDQPSFASIPLRADVAENISRLAARRGIHAHALYPTFFEREPIEGVWRLHNYGLYGVGTVFSNSFYHLFQSRFGSNTDLFVKRCNEISAGEFSTTGMFSSLDFNYDGRIFNTFKNQLNR